MKIILLLLFLFLSSQVYPQNEGCRGLDGIDDYVDTNEQAIFQFGTGDYSYMFWMYPTNWGSDYVVPISNDHYSGMWESIHITCERGVAPLNRCRVYSGDNFNWLNSVTVFTNNNWYHITVTRVSGLVTIYVNGVYDNSTTITNSVTVARNMYIGRNVDPTYPRHFQGRIDEVRFWNYGLSSEQIPEKMDRVIADEEPGLIWHSNMDEPAGNVFDRSKTGGAGTVTGTYADINAPIKRIIGE